MSLLFTLISLLTGYLLLSRLVHRAYRAPRKVETGSPAEYGLTYQSVSIPTENDKRLFAWYIPPQDQKEPTPAVVVIHGYGWGGNAEFMLTFAQGFQQIGYVTLLLDARNHGTSDSDTFSSLPRFAEDLEHGFEWLASRNEVDPKRIALLGHSVGAGAALLLAARRRDVAAVVSIAALSPPEALMRRQLKDHHIPYVPFGWMVLRFIECIIGTRYDTIAPLNTIQKIHCPVLLVHGCNDLSVPVSDAEKIYAGRAHLHVVLLTLPGAAHDSVAFIEKNWNMWNDFLVNTLRNPVSLSTK